MARKIDTMSADEIKAVLEDLISSAQTIDSYEDSVFADERDCARYETKEMVETLVKLGREA